MQVHALNKFPIAWVFHNIELYLNIGCKPNAGNTNQVIQSRFFSRLEAISTFCTQNWFAVASILENTLVALRPFIPTSVKLSCDPITLGATTMRILFCHCQVLVSVSESESSSMTSAIPKPAKMFVTAVQPLLKVTCGDL